MTLAMWGSISLGAQPEAKCSLKTLKGFYIYGATGVKGNVVHVEGGQEIFDGKGGITNTYTDSSGSVTVTSGSYEMSDYCIGRATYHDTGDSYVMYTGPDGTEFSWLSISKGTEIAGREVRVSPSVKPKCSLRTLKGTYIYSYMGYRNGIRYFESGQERFDGHGNFVNNYTGANGEATVTTGTYTMERNCIGTTTYNDTGESYAVYVSPAGDEFRYVSLGSGLKNIAVGSEQRVSRSIIKP